VHKVGNKTECNNMHGERIKIKKEAKPYLTVLDVKREKWKKIQYQ